jgi:hypothetical protein
MQRSHGSQSDFRIFARSIVVEQKMGIQAIFSCLIAPATRRELAELGIAKNGMCSYGVL